MDGLLSSSPTHRVRARVTRAALVAAIATTGLLAAPGVAAAAPSDPLRPLVTCVKVNPDRTYTAVFGYRNPTSSTIRVPVGSRGNTFEPRRLNSALPSVFEPGEHHGVFSVTLKDDAEWQLGTEDASVDARTTPACPASTELPEEGNGTGPAIGLAVAGLVGGVMVHRANRRARALTEASRGDA